MGEWFKLIFKYSGLVPFLLSNNSQKSKYKEGLKGKTKDGKLVTYKNGKWVLDISRKHDNTSKTNIKSLQLEDKMHEYIVNSLKERLRKGATTSWNYATPYLEEKEIKLTNAGKYTGMKLPTNVLDTIAKYAKITNTPIKDGLGLLFQESAKGNTPYFNYDDKGGVKGLPGFTKRDLGNTEYFKNYGIIPTENLFRDFEYTRGKDNNGNPHEGPPAEHAFKYFKSGKYNPGDPNHTKDVRAAGEAVWKSPEIQEWWKTTEYRKFGGTIKKAEH